MAKKFKTTKEEEEEEDDKLLIEDVNKDRSKKQGLFNDKT